MTNKKTITIDETANRILDGAPEWVKNGGRIEGFFCGMGVAKLGDENFNDVQNIAKKRALADLALNLQRSISRDSIYHKTVKQGKTAKEIEDNNVLETKPIMTDIIVFEDKWNSPAGYIFVIKCQ